LHGSHRDPQLLAARLDGGAQPLPRARHVAVLRHRLSATADAHRAHAAQSRPRTQRNRVRKEPAGPRAETTLLTAARSAGAAAHELAQPRWFHLSALALCAVAFPILRRRWLWIVPPLLACELALLIFAWRAHVHDSGAKVRAPARFSSARAYDVLIAGDALYF